MALPGPTATFLRLSPPRGQRLRLSPPAEPNDLDPQHHTHSAIGPWRSSAPAESHEPLAASAARALCARIDSLIFLGLALTSFCTSFIAAVTASAGGLLLLGTLALVFPPAVLIPVHTVVMLGDNISRVTIMRRHVLRPVLLPFLIGAALGAAAGGRIFVALPETTLQVILGVFIILFTWMPNCG